MKKGYWVLAVVVFLVGLDWVIRAPDSRARQLTGVIEAQSGAAARNFPYKFRVLKVSDEVAYVATPRNVDVPAFRFLAVLYPDINTKNPNDPAFIAVERQLGEVQSEARAIVLAQPGIKEVRWELDREWLRAHAVEVPDK